MNKRNLFFTWRALLVAMALVLMSTGVVLAQDTPATPDPVAPAAQAGGPRNGQAAGQNGGQGANFADADGDGQCDNFVDADGDGQCDNAGAAMMQRQGNMQGRHAMRGMHSGSGIMQRLGNMLHNQGGMRGQGGMYGLGQGLNQGSGPLFADADGDGVCDNMQSGANADD
jgi:hypothetical protein